MNKLPSLPFGLRFKERPVDGDFPISIYDEEEDISVIIDKDGRKTPSVEFHGNLATQTFTKVQTESSDDDENSLQMISTKTVTEVKGEISDSDDDLFSLSLSTITQTFVQSEGTDADPGTDTNPKPPTTTSTLTNVVREETDND